MKKRITALFLSTVIIGLAIRPVYAAENMSKEIIEQIIVEAYLSGDLNNIESSDIQDMQFASPISSYEVVNEQLILMDNYVYPIIAGNKICALIIKTLTANSYMYTYTSSFVNLLNSINIGNDAGIAFVYDECGVYLWNGEKIIRLYEYNEFSRIGERGCIERISADVFLRLNTQRVIAIDNLNIGRTMSNASDDDTRYAYLNVPLVQQETPVWCWAACMESVLEKIYGGNYTQTEIAARCGKSTAQTANFYEIQNGLSSYGLTNTNLDATKNSSYILNSLSKNYPCIASFGNDVANIIHAVVVRAIDFPAMSFFVMDPESGSSVRGNIVEESVSGDVLQYYSVIYGKTLTMRAFLYFE